MNHVEQTSARAEQSWLAVHSLSMTVIGLIAAEIFPISLLTPIARDLDASEALAGQAVTVTAASAMLASLLTATWTRTIDRKLVFSAFAVILTISSLLSASATSIEALFASRLLLGISLGGFWSLSAAVTVSLAPRGQSAKALATVYGSISIALVIAPPAAAFIEDHLGWRAVFYVSATWGLLSLIFQLFSLPDIPPAGTARLSTFGELLSNRVFLSGLGCIFLFYGSHFAFLTFLRPYLDTELDLSVNSVAVVFLLFGVGNFVGTHLAGHLAKRKLRIILLFLPLGMAAMATLLAFLESWLLGSLIVIFWGLAFGMGPVAWAAWMTGLAGDKTETAGSIQIACVQLAIASGVAMAGIVFTAGGATFIFLMCAAALFLTALIAKTCLASGDK